MLKAYKYRIYPNKTQTVLLNKTFGCVRYFWNLQVAIFNSYDKESNSKPKYQTSTEVRSEIKWMKEVSATALQQKERDFDDYKKQRFSKTRKKVIRNPSFKKKSNKQSFRLSNSSFKIVENKIKLQKIGNIKIILDRGLPEGKLMSVTISKNPSNQYFASITIETEIKHKPKTNKEVGIDLGLKEFLVQSDDIVVPNPRYFRESQAKLARLQRYLSRKKKGSNRRRKCRLKVARLHQKITNQRDWFLHNESTRLINSYDKIVIEDLNVEGMVKNHKLAKSISDASWSKFVSMLDYKALWYDKGVVKIGRFEPSSKTCSRCGWINKELTLKDRMFVCPNCNLSIDRDKNAAINIKAFGVANAIRTSSKEVTNCVEMSITN